MTALLLIALIVLGLAYANGANDNFKGVATLFGSGASTIAVAWVTTLPVSATLAAGVYLAPADARRLSGACARSARPHTSRARR